MKASPPDENAAEIRPSSVISRQVRDGRRVYVKRYVPGDRFRTDEVIRTRLAREVDVVARLAALPEMRGRLGILNVVEADPQQAELVSEEAPGRPLQHFLLGEYRRSVGRDGLSALYSAGKWLRVFQTLAVRTGEDARLTGEPVDLVEYCDVRLGTIRKLGYDWPSAKARVDFLNQLDALVKQAPEQDRQRVWCHCDYGPFNVLWDGRVLTAIDFAMCKPGYSLLDVTHFVHHLEMLPLQFPWRTWPVRTWKRAFLRGYGRSGVEAAPMYRALMLRHTLCRLQSLLRRPGDGRLQRLHSAWLRRRLRAWLK